MIDQEIFLNHDLMMPVIIGAILVWIVFILKELPLTNKIRFVGRLFATTLVIISLALLILVPIIEIGIKNDKLIVLTDNYSEQKLDSLKDLYRDIGILQYSPNSQIIPDSLETNSLILLGNGLYPFDFWQLNNRSVRYLKSELPTGINSVNFRTSHSLYSKLDLNGLVNGSVRGDKIILEGPSGKALDSAVLVGEDKEEFNLQSQLDVSGRFIYQILEKDSSGLIKSKNPLPVLVEEPAVLKILMLNAFPTFESKYLKNFLTDSNHKIISRIQLTKGRYKYEYFNLPVQSINSFTNDNLNDFDLIIADRTSIQNLNSGDLNVLQQQLKEVGLGLLMLPDTDVFTKEGSLMNFEFLYDGDSQVVLSSISPFSIDKYSYDIIEKKNIVPIELSEDNVVSAYQRYGIGKIGTTTLKNTYSLLLKGQDSIYKRIWTNIISTVAKDTDKQAELILTNDFNFVDEPMEFKLRTNYSNPELKAEEGYRIPLRQDLYIPYLWTGITYPKRTGWRNMELKRDSMSSLDYYVYDKLDWRSIVTVNRIRENELQFTDDSINITKTESRAPMNLIYLYVILILGLGYLWLVPKLGHSSL